MAGGNGWYTAGAMARRLGVSVKALRVYERAGLVARIVPADALVEEAVKTAETVAGMAPLAVKANKEMVNAAFETTLTQGVLFERRLFHGLFGTADQKEGMAAFVEKRKPDFRNA